MEEATFIISEGSYMIIIDRDAFIAALEAYVLAMDVLPERAESLHAREEQNGNNRGSHQRSSGM